MRINFSVFEHPVCIAECEQRQRDLQDLSEDHCGLVILTLLLKISSPSFTFSLAYRVFKFRKGFFLKFEYSEKATKFCEIFTLLLTGIGVHRTKVR